MPLSKRNKLREPSRLKIPAYDEIGVALQGGGALGSYQAGVCEGLVEVGVEPTRISGVRDVSFPVVVRGKSWR